MDTCENNVTTTRQPGGAVGEPSRSGAVADTAPAFARRDDAFDRFWQWANKPLDSHETELHHEVSSLPVEDWYDRATRFRDQRAPRNETGRRSKRRR